MAPQWHSSIAYALLFALAVGFNLYPPLDPKMLAKAYNISTDCLSILNTTLPSCDQTLYQMVGSLDNYWWEEDNITTICSSNCSFESETWRQDVVATCWDETISAYGKLIPASSIAQRFDEGMQIACLGSTKNDTWCLTESQTWVGSDVITPDCAANPSNPSCSSNTTDPENQRMANLYSNDVLCDDCFIQMLYLRVTSLYLPNSDHSEYLIDQLQDIVDVCSTTIPNITVSVPPVFNAAPPPTSIRFRTTTTTSAPATTTTCYGQAVSAPKKRAAQGRSVDDQQATTGCDALSKQYGVTTGDLQLRSQSATCVISGVICIPKACSLLQVPAGATCDSLAKSLPGNITTVQFMNWNPNIMGLCDAVTPGQYVCKSAPGVNGTFVLATPPLGTDADAGNQNRGGPTGPPTTACTTPTGVLSSAPTATQTGIVASCNRYAFATGGIGCYDFATQNCITPSQLYLWNGVLGPNGENCTSLFWAKTYYCVGVSGSAASTTTKSTATVAPTSTKVVVTAPGPTQSGIVSNCNKFAVAPAGSGCWDMANSNGITTDQLYAWNPVLGAAGANCGTMLWAKEWYCVGVGS